MLHMVNSVQKSRTLNIDTETAVDTQLDIKQTFFFSLLFLRGVCARECLWCVGH